MIRRIRPAVVFALIAVITVAFTSCGDSVRKKPENPASLPAAESPAPENEQVPAQTGEIQLPPLA